MLFEAFAGAEIQDCGGEEDECSDGENCVGHERKNRFFMLRKWSARDKDFVRVRAEVMTPPSPRVFLRKDVIPREMHGAMC
jgi:hypothetical protein